MVNKPKAKGTAGETRVVKYLMATGLTARRVVLKGSSDEGDIHIDNPPFKGGLWVLEVKSGRQTQNISRKQREDWLKETRTEGRNAGTDKTFLVIAKHGSSVADYHVWSSNGTQFWYLDEFARMLNVGIT